MERRPSCGHLDLERNQQAWASGTMVRSGPRNRSGSSSPINKQTFDNGDIPHRRIKQSTRHRWGFRSIGCPSCPFKGRPKKANWLQHCALLDLFPRSQRGGRGFESPLVHQHLLQAQQLTQPCEIRSVGRVGHFSDFCVLEAKIPCLLSLPILISIRAASEASCKPRTREFWRVPTRCVARPPELPPSLAW